MSDASVDVARAAAIAPLVTVRAQDNIFVAPALAAGLVSVRDVHRCPGWVMRRGH
jgi:hypothetical protein